MCLEIQSLTGLLYLVMVVRLQLDNRCVLLTILKPSKHVRTHNNYVLSMYCATERWICVYYIFFLWRRLSTGWRSSSWVLNGPSLLMVFQTGSKKNISGFKRPLEYESYLLANRENYLLIYPCFSVMLSVRTALRMFQAKGRGYKWRPNPREICHQRRQKTERDVWKITKEREIKKQSPCCFPAAGILGFEWQIFVGKWRVSRCAAQSGEVIPFQ